MSTSRLLNPPPHPWHEPTSTWHQPSSESASRSSMMGPYQGDPVAGPSTPRRSRPREILTSFRDLVHSSSPTMKGVATTELSRESIEVETASNLIHLTPPPSLPNCSLSATFTCAETSADIPPAFYPGQSIPTILTYHLNQSQCLPHALNPLLTMSLIGTLHITNGAPRTIICVSVSLAEGLELWAKDAKLAYASRIPKDRRVDPETSLPGGTYSLPLTVQVPSTPRLPPSYNIPNSTFAVTYALQVVMSCDDPLRPGHRVTLAEVSRGFEMMPETMPTRIPRYTSTTFTVRPASAPTPGSIGIKGLARKSSSRWTVVPSLPTTAFSPTSIIPLKLTLTPPADLAESYRVLVRVAVVRREHSSIVGSTTRDSSGQPGLVQEVDITSRVAWFKGTPQPLNIETVLPMMLDDNWLYGFSTTLNVGQPAGAPAPANPSDNIAVSSTFHLAATFAFFPDVPDRDSIRELTGLALPAQGVFTPAQKGSLFDVGALKKHLPGTVRTLPLPIVVGSVSEPRSAMRVTRWSDLHLDRSTGVEVGSMINGEATSCEDGWLQAPPSYADALEAAPYVY